MVQLPRLSCLAADVEHCTGGGPQRLSMDSPLCVPTATIKASRLVAITAQNLISAGSIAGRKGMKDMPKSKVAKTK